MNPLIFSRKDMRGIFSPSCSQCSPSVLGKRGACRLNNGRRDIGAHCWVGQPFGILKTEYPMHKYVCTGAPKGKARPRMRQDCQRHERPTSNGSVTVEGDVRHARCVQIMIHLPSHNHKY